jgi:hypothetical protein
LSAGHRAFPRDVLSVSDVTTGEIPAWTKHDERPFTLRIARTQEVESA